MASRRVGYSLRQQKSGRWQVRVFDPVTGEHVGMGTYADKRAAEQAGQDEAGRVRSASWIDPRRADVPLGEYLTAWLARRAASARHGERYAEDASRLAKLHIIPTLGRVVLTDLSPSVVARWYDDLAAKRIAASGTVGVIPAKAYRLLHAALEDAVRDQLLPRNPCMMRSAGVERSPERPLLEVAQVLDLIDVMPRRWRTLVLVAGFCALRFGELGALRRRDVDPLRSQIAVERTLVELTGGKMVMKDRPKTAAGHRVVAVPMAVMDELVAHLDRYTGPEPDALVFTGARGGALRRSNFSDHFAVAVKAAGMSGVTFHDLRHAAGTLAAQMGATERELQARLGHASPDAARRYQHAAQRRDVELAERLGGALDAARAGRTAQGEVIDAARWRTDGASGRKGVEK